MVVYCDEIEREIASVHIDNEDYWIAQDFAHLTQRKIGAIRVLFSKGNRLRKLKGKNINGRLYILASELFDFPFVTNGHPAKEGDYFEKFYLKEGSLFREDSLAKRVEA